MVGIWGASGSYSLGEERCFKQVSPNTHHVYRVFTMSTKHKNNSWMREYYQYHVSSLYTCVIHGNTLGSMLEKNYLE